ncbi:AbrB/MazE/SpoVT family DNA-binding domain-containing protein [Acetomicrobium hydrogeniformans]|uniref:Transcriptional regulator, AbrB family n=1 Tax=Acetomicrobium hydrogeniformans ATCC BAA-1850 TaxID=592015 RepID=A0A0T5X9P1_9BACT|nr:AbrB/MazE/SpoVT family DNA-binding domain-containing protein [Acetomicrobium hydrogeniformans]KRT35095.1 transcriptional regulator, AbrB family [Acetomicrobium hydrogeniformans ATCC BAA-1850]
MADTKEVAVRIDSKGRITLPRSMRKALGVKAGDTLFFKYDPQSNRLQIAPAVSPFDALAKEAIKEYKEGHTRTIEEYAKEKDIPSDVK